MTCTPFWAARSAGIPAVESVTTITGFMTASSPDSHKQITLLNTRKGVWVRGGLRRAPSAFDLFGDPSGVEQGQASLSAKTLDGQLSHLIESVFQAVTTTFVALVSFVARPFHNRRDSFHLVAPHHHR
jgi:hypothetical protein